MIQELIDGAPSIPSKTMAKSKLSIIDQESRSDTDGLSFDKDSSADTVSEIK